MLTRAQFFQCLDGAIARAKLSGQLVGLLLLNLDHFRELNLRRGRVLADAVLVTMAKRLSECVRAGDAVARIGSDEFTVILEGLAHADGAATTTARLLAALELPLDLQSRDMSVTASVGIAFYPSDAPSAEALLQSADFAVAHAREYNRNTCRIYSRELHSRELEHAAWRSQVMRRLASLTPREREVNRLLMAGKSNKWIGYELGRSMRTIENHRASIIKKMHARSLPELVRMMVEVEGGRAATKAAVPTVD